MSALGGMLAAVIVLALAILAALVMLLRKAAKVTHIGEAPAPPKPPAPGELQIGGALNRARRNAPLVILLGGDGSREPHFLEHAAGSGLELRDADDGMAVFDGGAVLDAEADGAAWTTVVRQLMHARPGRPADAVVVTVGCRALLDGAGDLAAQVRDRLAALQDESGFRLPLYVLVTGCETLDGFGDTAAALRASFPQMLGQMLGWSSPYGAQVPYQSTWIDDAFRELNPVLAHLQMELFRWGPQKDGVLRFPWSCAALAEPLRAYLDRLLNAGALREPPMTRGIYFCGKLPESANTAFVAELFAKKIFPEAGLAAPTAAVRAKRARNVRALKLATAAAAIAAIAGVVLAAMHLNARYDALDGLLTSAKFGIDQVDRGMADDQVRGAAADFLGRMARDGVAHASPWWLPFSRLTGFDDRLHEALGTAVDIVVLKAIYTRLNDDANDSIAAASEPRPVVDVDLTAPAKTAEALRLQTFVDKMREVERQGAVFNRVAANGGGVQALAPLVKSVFGVDLPPAFAPAIRLKSALHFEPAGYQARASFAAGNCKQALYTRIFDQNACAADVGRVAALLGGNGSTPRLRELDGAIHALQKDLSSPAAEWAFRPQLDLGPELRSAFDTVGRSSMFAKDTDKQFRADGTASLAALQARLSTNSALGTPVLKLREENKPLMELAPATVLYHAAVEKLLGQSPVPVPFVQFPLRTPMPDERLTWDGGAMEQSAAAYRAFKEFRDGGMKPFPPDLSRNVRDDIDNTARQRAAVEMTDALGRAQRFERVTPAIGAQRDEALRADAAQFDAAAKALRPQLAELQELRADGTRNAVIAAVSAEAMRLLRETDAILGEAAPYKPRGGNFAWWDGAEPPSPAGWGPRDAAALGEYFETTRSRVTTLAGYAEPPLTWLEEFPAGSDPLARGRWRSIVDDLGGFKNKKPGNAVASIEDYIAARSTNVTNADCSGATLKPAEAIARGYFAATLQSMAKLLGDRCRVLAAERAASHYDRLARFFNQKLADRFPFAGDVGEVEADPEDVRNFFARFDKVKPLFGAVDDEATPWLGPAHDFVRRMARVREFFAAFLDPKKPPRLPELNVETSFRVQKEREHGANEIILWSLEVGRDATTQRKAKTLLWQPGTPVTLTLRWADDAPRVPVLPSPQRNVSIEDRAVVYRYSNTWSLLAALDALRADDDAKPVTLAINVLTRPAAGGDPDPRNPSLLFLRLALSSRDGQPLDVPTFPQSAPALDRRTAEVSQ